LILILTNIDSLINFSILSKHSLKFGSDFAISSEEWGARRNPMETQLIGPRPQGLDQRSKIERRRANQKICSKFS